MAHRNITASIACYMAAFLLILSCTQRSQTTTGSQDSLSADTAVASPDTLTHSKPGLSTVEDIRRSYTATIGKLQRGELDSASFTYDCSGERSGTVSYFTEAGNLKMIIHRYSEYSHYSATDRYFVQDNQLYFAYLNGVSWTFDGAEGATRDDITEQRIYLVDEKPVKCLEKKYTTRSAATDNPKSETVPSKDVKCKPAAAILKPYQILLKYHNKPAPSCLEN